MHPSNNSDPLKLVLSRLERVKRFRDCYVASCPVQGHGKGRGDKNPSLSIGIGDESQVLLRCHAGCSTDAIVAAIGLTHTDVYPSKNVPKGCRTGRVPVIHDSIDSGRV